MIHSKRFAGPGRFYPNTDPCCPPIHFDTTPRTLIGKTISYPVLFIVCLIWVVAIGQMAIDMTRLTMQRIEYTSNTISFPDYYRDVTFAEFRKDQS